MCRYYSRNSRRAAQSPDLERWRHRLQASRDLVSRPVSAQGRSLINRRRWLGQAVHQVLVQDRSLQPHRPYPGQDRRKALDLVRWQSKAHPFLEVVSPEALEAERYSLGTRNCLGRESRRKDREHYHHPPLPSQDQESPYHPEAAPWRHSLGRLLEVGQAHRPEPAHSWHRPQSQADRVARSLRELEAWAPLRQPCSAMGRYPELNSLPSLPLLRMEMAVEDSVDGVHTIRSRQQRIVRYRAARRLRKRMMR